MIFSSLWKYPAVPSVYCCSVTHLIIQVDYCPDTVYQSVLVEKGIDSANSTDMLFFVAEMLSSISRKFVKCHYGN